MRFREFVALAFLALGSVGLSEADTVTLAPTDDMYTDPEHPGAHTAGELWVANYSGAGHFQRINIKFDLSGITGNVESATLSLYRFFMCPSHPSTTTDIYAIEQDWNENTWPENQHIPHGSDVWATYTFGPDNPAWYHVDITELTRAWVEGGTTNFGLVIHTRSGEKFSKFRSKEYTNPNQHPYLMVTYTGTATYSIGGNIYTEDETPLTGVTVVLSGDAYDQTTTNADGWYSFPNLNQGGAYTVAPSYSNEAGIWLFDPESRTYEFLNSDHWSDDYTGTPPSYTISGAVKGREDSGIEGVLIKLDGGKTDSVFTDQQGDYSLTDIPGGLAYSITPSLTFDDSVIWYFSPEAIQIDTLMADQSGLEFLAQLPVLLYVGDGEGQPGSTGNPVEIDFDNETYNSLSIDSLTFILLYTSANGAHLPAEGALELVGRAEGFDVVYEVNEENPAACSLHVTLTGDDPLPPGTDAICHLLFSLDAEADTAYATSLSFTTASVKDTVGMLIPVDFGDTGIFRSGVGTSLATRSIKLRLRPPTPNPSKGAVRFSFQIPRNSRTTVVISDLAGRIVTRLDQGVLETGIHSILWDGNSHHGQALPSGAYHCRLVSCGESAQSIVVLLR